MTSESSSTFDLDQLVPAWLAACKALDAKAVASFFTLDAVYEDVGFKHTLYGQAEVETWYRDWFAAYPDFTMELLGGFVSDYNAVMEWEFTATLTGSFFGIPDSMRGKTRTVRGASIVEFGDIGKITKQRDYWHVPDLST